MNLITRERALRNISDLASPTAADLLLVDALVAACCEAVENACRRRFAVQAFDELYDGQGRFVLHLRNFPVVSVERVAYDPIAMFKVQNTSASNQQARVKVTGDGLTLTRVASGATSTATVTFAANATLSALATAVAALGNGWWAEVLTGYGSHPAADLRATQGAFNARDGYAEFRVHVQELRDFEVDEERGRLLRGGATGPLGCDGERLAFHGGSGSWRVIYTAGFSAVPEPVQEACAEWVARRFKLARRDPAVANTFSSSAGSSYAADEDGPPATVRALLAPYRVHWI